LRIWQLLEPSLVLNGVKVNEAYGDLKKRGRGGVGTDVQKKGNAKFKKTRKKSAIKERDQGACAPEERRAVGRPTLGQRNMGSAYIK